MGDGTGILVVGELADGAPISATLEALAAARAAVRCARRRAGCRAAARRSSRRRAADCHRLWRRRCLHGSGPGARRRESRGADSCRGGRRRARRPAVRHRLEDDYGQGRDAEARLPAWHGARPGLHRARGRRERTSVGDAANVRRQHRSNGRLPRDPRCGRAEGTERRCARAGSLAHRARRRS